MSIDRSSHAPGRIRRTTAYVIVAGLLGLAPVTAPSASAADTRVALSPSAPRISEIHCRSRCTGGSVERDSHLDLRGRAIARVNAVTFLGGDGTADDVTVAPARVTRRRIVVQVPTFARSGPVAVASADGAESPPSRISITMVAPTAEGAPGLEVEVQSPKAYFDGTRKASVAFVLRGTEAREVDVVLQRATEGAPLVRWTPGLLQPGVPRTVTWNGTADGRVQPPGQYRFQVQLRSDAGAADPGAAAAAATPASDPQTFELLDHQFPVRGPHRYGGGGAQFGGGRGHQGHDVFAACGTPLVAARGGRVRFKQFHSRAGHYLVIDGERTDRDYAYMHLRDAALVHEGERVRTGQPIGFVGQTGRASGCHLHFELWSAPGWYEGGQPYDPLPSLRAWDEAS